MEIRQLKYFLVVCKYGNITKAAEEIHISQQTLSKQMKDFEDELDLPLFIRSKRGVELTPYSKCLIGPAQRIVQEADEALMMLEKMRPPETILVRLGYMRDSANFRYALPPRTMFEWERHFPQMKLEVRDYAPQELQKKLIEDELELIYTVGEVAPGLCRVPIANEPAGLLINETNPLASCTRLHSEQLRNEKFLLASQEPLPKEERDQLARYLGFSPQFVSFEGTFEEGPEHVRRNEGVLFCGFTYSVTQDMHGLVAVPFPAQAAVFRHFLAYRKDRKLSAPVRWLLAEQTHPQE